MATRKHTRRRRARARKTPPDLNAILGAFADAYALLTVASMAVSENLHSGPESIVLRIGVGALNRAYNQLDMAIIQLGSSGMKP